jgi:hypothetical protein
VKKDKVYTALTYVLGSLIFLAIPVLSSPDLNRDDLWSIPPFQRDFISYVLLLLFFFINYFVLTPQLYFNKKYLGFALILIAIYLFIEFVPGFIVHENFMRKPDHPFIGPGPGKHGPPHPRGFVHELTRHLFLFLAIVIFSIMMKIRDKWKQTQREKTNAELSYLKAQINPHFLFNTLNSIYSLALEKSDDTATAVVKLSGMMRYVLSEANHEYVSLEKEIHYINDYIDLQKLRLADTIFLDYSVDGNSNGKKIAPLILIPFIENAFKYGVNPEERSEIIIKIEIRAQSVFLYVKNKKVHTNISKLEKSGLGINNTKHRLQLVYPAKHLLSIQDTEREFLVSLTLEV